MSQAATSPAGALIEVSRDPQNEWVPARVTLLAAWTGGRDPLRGLAGGPAIFLMLFVLVGTSLAALGAWGRFWAPPERAEGLADPAFHPAAVAVGEDLPWIRHC